MEYSQDNYIDQFRQMGKLVDKLSSAYWNDYASFDTWQFWLNIVFLIGPLIVLLLFIDRNQIFRILFFGFTIHALMNYIDATVVAKGFVFHPYPLIPIIDINLSINTSLIPVTFMLFYQYGLNKKKNLYVVGFVAAICTGIILGTFADSVDILRLYRENNVFFVFLVDYIEFILAFWLTCFFDYLTRKKSILD